MCILHTLKQEHSGDLTSTNRTRLKFNLLSVVHAQGDMYQDRWRYRDSKQEKKKGFLTSDFSKRDEFSNTIRTGQWREQLKVSTNM